VPHPTEHPDDPHQDDEVEDADHEQEDAGHARSDHTGQLVQQGSVVGHLAGQALDPPREQRSQHEHDRRVAQREEESDAERPLTVAHQLAGRVVDRGDVVGVKGVPHAERVRRDPDPEPEHGAVAEGELRRHDESEQQPEADDVERGDRGEQTGGPPPLCGRQRVLDAAASVTPRCGVPA
jgi:hypothetical protein